MKLNVIDFATYTCKIATSFWLTVLLMKMKCLPKERVIRPREYKNCFYPEFTI